MPLPYTTTDIQLRALNSDDLPLLLAWENTPEAQQSNEALNPLSSDFISRYIAASAQHILETGSLGLMIERTADQHPLGHLVLYEYSALHRRVAVGLFVAPEARQQGIASLALQQAIAYAFSRLRCEQVYAEVLGDNKHVHHMLRHLGFTHTATLPHWSWTGEDYQDLLYFQLWNQ